jgi:hypothetical protein
VFLNQLRFNAAQRFVWGGHLMTLKYSMAAFAASARIGLGGDRAFSRGALIRKAALAVVVGGSGVGMLALASAAPAQADVQWLSGTSLNSIFDTKTPGESDDGFAFMNEGSLSADGMSFSASFANNNSDPDFNFLTNAPVTIGNGQANIKATDSNWTTMTVTPGMLSFDGFFMRGTVDQPGGVKCEPCEVTFDVAFSDNSTASNTFDTIKNSGDFGAIGFDEVPGTTGLSVSSVVVSVTGGDNFDQIKQTGFSGTGEPPTIPETSTWAMMLLGFAGLGYAAWRGRRKGGVSIIEA